MSDWILHKFPAVGTPASPLGGYDNTRAEDDDPALASVQQMQAVIASLGLRVRALPGGGAEAIEVGTGRVKYTGYTISELLEQIRKNAMENHKSGVTGITWDKTHQHYDVIAESSDGHRKYFATFPENQLDLAKQARLEASDTLLANWPDLKEKYKQRRDERRRQGTETLPVPVTPKLPAPTADIHALLDRALAANAAYHQAMDQARRAKADFEAAWGEYLVALGKLGIVAAQDDLIDS